METTAVIYRILLLGHIASAIVGFGALIAHGGYHASAARSPAADALPLLRATDRGARVAEYGLYGVLAFGILLIALSDDVFRYREPWLVAALIIWLVIIGLVHGLVRPARTRLSDLAAVGDGDDDLADSKAARPILARLALGEAGVQLLLAAALILMIWKPGH